MESSSLKKNRLNANSRMAIREVTINVVLIPANESTITKAIKGIKPNKIPELSTYFP